MARNLFVLTLNWSHLLLIGTKVQYVKLRMRDVNKAFCQAHSWKLEAYSCHNVGIMFLCSPKEEAYSRRFVRPSRYFVWQKNYCCQLNQTWYMYIDRWQWEKGQNPRTIILPFIFTVLSPLNHFYTPEGDVLCYRLGVRPSVCLSDSNFPSALEALEGFRRNLTQMLTRLRWRAEAMFWMAGFKVKVILRGQRPYDFFSLQLCNSWTPRRISKKPDTNVYQTETMCRSNVLDGWIQGHGLAIY